MGSGKVHLNFLRPYADTFVYQCHKQKQGVKKMTLFKCDNDPRHPGKYFLVTTYYTKNPKTKKFTNVVADTYEPYDSISEVVSRYRETLLDEGLFDSHICKVLHTSRYPSRLTFIYCLEKILSLFIRRGVK